MSRFLLTQAPRHLPPWLIFDVDMAKKQSHSMNRTFLAIIACIGIFLLHTLISVALGWRHGGGLIPMLVLWGLMVFTWRLIRAGGSAASTSSTTDSDNEDNT